MPLIRGEAARRISERLHANPEFQRCLAEANAEMAEARRVGKAPETVRAEDLIQRLRERT